MQALLRRPLRLLLVGSIFCVGFVASTAAAAPNSSLRNVQRGVIAAASISTSAVGDALLGHVGGQVSRLEVLRGDRWVLQWDARVTVDAGVLGQSLPYTPMFGGQATGFAEGGYRFMPRRAWSAYAGVRLAAAGVLMPPWGVGLGSLRRVNSVAGVGGAGLDGALRLVGGASWLDGHRSVLLGLFVQESGRVAQPNLPGAAFTDVGATARFDVAGAFVLFGDVWWGSTPTLQDDALERRDRTSHVGAALDGRWMFHHGMWVGLRPSYDVELDHITYPTSGTSYVTRNAPSFRVALLYGYPLGSIP